MKDFRYVARKLQSFLFLTQKKLINTNKVFFVSDEIEENILKNIKRRFEYYCPDSSLNATSPQKALLSNYPIITFDGPSFINSYFQKIRFGIFNIDYRSNPQDAWEWIDLANTISKHNYNRINSRKKLISRMRNLKRSDLKKAYIFGTGPSLENATEKNWEDGYRIVCNTIVRDSILWNHINPHFIVAGDAIYHFGFTNFAKQFRNDLKRRLNETETMFVYPAVFDYIVQRELSDFHDRLIPIPVGHQNTVHQNLTEVFALPGMDNVLLLLLLPLACTLSDNVYLWGFDGKAPKDELFWRNSQKHSYPELLPELVEAHPCFFEEHVPKSNPFKYVEKVHGNLLEQALTIAEKEGFRFVMMHKSYTPVLQQRYHESMKNNFN